MAGVAESEHCIAFRDINPQAPVHVLVIPRTHVASLASPAEAHVLSDLLSLVAVVAVREGIDQTGFRTVFNTGPAAGQSIFHLHAHVLGGRDLTWPPG